MKSFGTQTINAIATDPEKLKKILSARMFSIIQLTTKKYLSFFYLYAWNRYLWVVFTFQFLEMLQQIDL